MSDDNSFIAFLCPNCHQELEAPRAAAGQTFPCPACGTKFIVPTTPLPPPDLGPSPAQSNAMKSRTVRIELTDL